MRNKPHYKHSFEKDKHGKRGTISLDQVTVADEVGTMGISGYKYGIVFSKVGTTFWRFVPLRSLTAKEAGIAFETFLKLTNSTPANTGSLREVREFGAGQDSTFHPCRRPREGWEVTATTCLTGFVKRSAMELDRI